MTIRKSLWLPRDWIFPFLFFLISSAFIGGIVVGERFSPLFHLNRITQYGSTEFGLAHEDESTAQLDCANAQVSIRIVHRVSSGDMLCSSAHDYCLSVTLLKFVNCIPEDNRIFLDKPLLIPEDVPV
ncbi:hypothetical protein KC902_01215 [Candidatus Kaiserbacteria bacterium]|nr:hypothetical protein [Candidatus Kaiserbacteria bacterium]